jgi:hypothetical protein
MNEPRKGQEMAPTNQLKAAETASPPQDFYRSLRDAVVSEIDRRSLDADSVAEIVGMLPSGAAALLQREVWPVETALRVAGALGLRIEPRAERVNQQ